MALFYFFVSILFLLYIKTIEKTLFTPSSLIVLTWGIFPGIYCLGPQHLYELAFNTHVVIILSLFTFFISYYFFYFNTGKKENRVIVPVSFENDINYKFLIVSNLVIAVWMFPILINSWANLLISGMVHQRAVFLDNLGTLTVSIYEAFAKPMIIASLAILSIDFFRQGGNKKLRLILILVIVYNIFVETVVFAARATTIKVVYYMFFSFLFIYRHSLTKKNKAMFVFFLAVLFIVISFVTSLRNAELDEGNSFFDTMISYYVTSFGLLNYYITHPSFSMLTADNFTYGACTFGFLYNIIQSAITVLFGTKYQGSDYLVTQITQERVPISPNATSNAMFTADYCFLRDFGYVGVVIGFVLFAFVIIKVKNYYLKNPSVRSGAMYVFFLYVTFRLSVSYDFLFSSAIYTIFFIWLGTKSSKRKLTRAYRNEKN